MTNDYTWLEPKLKTRQLNWHHSMAIWKPKPQFKPPTAAALNLKDATGVALTRNHWIDQGGKYQMANVGKSQSSWNQCRCTGCPKLFPSRSQEVGHTDRWHRQCDRWHRQVTQRFKGTKRIEESNVQYPRPQRPFNPRYPKAILGHLFQATSQQPPLRPSRTRARPTPSPPMSCDKRSRTKPASDGFQNKNHMMWLWKTLTVNANKQKPTSWFLEILSLITSL